MTEQQQPYTHEAAWDESGRMQKVLSDAPEIKLEIAEKVAEGKAEVLAIAQIESLEQISKLANTYKTLDAQRRQELKERYGVQVNDGLDYSDYERHVKVGDRMHIGYGRKIVKIDSPVLAHEIAQCTESVRQGSLFDDPFLGDRRELRNMMFKRDVPEETIDAINGFVAWDFSDVGRALDAAVSVGLVSPEQSDKIKQASKEGKVIASNAQWLALNSSYMPERDEGKQMYWIAMEPDQKTKIRQMAEELPGDVSESITNLGLNFDRLAVGTWWEALKTGVGYFMDGRDIDMARTLEYLKTGEIDFGGTPENYFNHLLGNFSSAKQIHEEYSKPRTEIFPSQTPVLHDEENNMVESSQSEEEAEKSSGERYIEKCFHPHPELPEEMPSIVRDAIDVWAKNTGLEQSFGEDWYRALQNGTGKLLVPLWNWELTARSVIPLVQSADIPALQQEVHSTLSNLSAAIDMGDRYTLLPKLQDKVGIDEAVKVTTEHVNELISVKKLVKQLEDSFEEIGDKNYSADRGSINKLILEIVALRYQSPDHEDAFGQTDSMINLIRELSATNGIPFACMLAGFAYDPKYYQAVQSLLSPEDYSLYKLTGINIKNNSIPGCGIRDFENAIRAIGSEISSYEDDMNA